MTTNDAKLTDALNAFCRRLVEGHPSLPTGQSWDETDLDTQNKIKTNFLGPLHTAAQVLTKPDVVTTAEELAALPLKSVILSDGGEAWQKEFTGLHGYTWVTYARHMDSRRAASTLLPATILHEGAK